MSPVICAVLFGFAALQVLAAGLTEGRMVGGVCTCKDGEKPCTDSPVPGHPDSKCSCASPQVPCPEYEDGRTMSADWHCEEGDCNPKPSPTTREQWHHHNSHNSGAAPTCAVAVLGLVLSVRI